MELRLDDIANHLKKMRADEGEDAYQLALKALAKRLIAGGSTEMVQSLLKSLEDSLDLTRLKAEVQADMKRAQASAEKAADSASASGANPMADALKAQIPNMKTQAQLDLFMSAFDALRLYFDQAYGPNPSHLEDLKSALLKAIDLAPRISEVVDKVAETPEATTNEDFKTPPRDEDGVYQALMGELEKQSTMTDLNSWYESSRSQMDTLTNQDLRNQLFDSIRARKKSLSTS